MRKIPLIFWLFVAIALGTVLGQALPAGGIRALTTFQFLFSQFVKFLVPLIVLAFVTPAIAEIGKGAGRILLTTVALAYASTLAAGFYAFAVSSAVLPAWLGTASISSAAAAKAFPTFFTLKIPPAVDVMTALTISFIFGLGMAASPSTRLLALFQEARAILERTIRVAFVPLLPLYIMTVIAELSASDRLVVVGGRAARLSLFCIVLSVSMLVIAFVLAGLVARCNPFKALVHMLPAYLTGWGTCSSVATMPLTLRQVKANGVSDATANLVVPLCANIHLPGSMLCLVGYSAGILALYGDPISFGPYVAFILSMSVVAVAAPGVPGGCILAAGSFVETLLGFTPDRYALMAALYLALDGLGTSANLTADGALALIVDRFRNTQTRKEKKE